MVSTLDNKATTRAVKMILTNDMAFRQNQLLNKTLPKATPVAKLHTEVMRAALTVVQNASFNASAVPTTVSSREYALKRSNRVPIRTESSHPSDMAALGFHSRKPTAANEETASWSSSWAPSQSLNEADVTRINNGDLRIAVSLTTKGVEKGTTPVIIVNGSAPAHTSQFDTMESQINSTEAFLARMRLFVKEARAHQMLQQSNAPVILPVKNDIKVKTGNTVKCKDPEFRLQLESEQATPAENNSSSQEQAPRFNSSTQEDSRLYKQWVPSNSAAENQSVDPADLSQKLLSSHSFALASTAQTGQTSDDGSFSADASPSVSPGVSDSKSIDWFEYAKKQEPAVPLLSPMGAKVKDFVSSPILGKPTKEMETFKQSANVDAVGVDWFSKASKRIVSNALPTVPIATATATKELLKAPIVSAETKTAAETLGPQAPNSRAKPPTATGETVDPKSLKRQPQPPSVEEHLQQKYASIDSLEERAYQILIDLGMVEQSGLVQEDVSFEL
jgi:hypothetical protein